MELTKKQKEGLDITIKRYHDKEKYTTISGFAGVGKSTLVKFIISALGNDGINPDTDVCYTAYTGKAAEVLRKKGNPNAMTLHKLLYTSIPKPSGGFFRKIKEALEYSIIVVDEVSMVPKTMIDILLKFPVYVIFLGDPFQLPQIDKNEAHDLLEHPHVFLDEVMRQAQESEIIRMTMKIRKFEPIDFSKGKEVIVIPHKELVTGHLLWADQVICSTNAKRTAINNQMRDLLGYSGILQDGEKIIVKRNYWDVFSEPKGDCLVNGMTGIVRDPFESFIKLPRYIRSDIKTINTIICNFIPDGEDGEAFLNIDFNKKFIEKEEPLDWKLTYQLGKLKPKIGDLIPKDATYGYAITAHAAQGSEYDNVLVIEESFPFVKTEHARWLYTAVSRSVEKCVLVR